MTETDQHSAPQPQYGDMGGRLRAIRLQRTISVRQLARQIGVSPSLISQIELGKAKPSVSTLYALTNALGISMNQVFSDAGTQTDGNGVVRQRAEGASADGGSGRPAAGGPVQRAATRRTLQLDTGVRWERLTTESTQGTDFLYCVYDVGSASTRACTAQRHEGREWGYIISGRLGVTLGFDDYELEPGDAIAFDSTIPHRLYNLGDEPVHGIWFVLGRRSTPHSLAAPG